MDNFIDKYLNSDDKTKTILPIKKKLLKITKALENVKLIKNNVVIIGDVRTSELEIIYSKILNNRLKKIFKLPVINRYQKKKSNKNYWIHYIEDNNNYNFCLILDNMPFISVIKNENMLFMTVKLLGCFKILNNSFVRYTLKENKKIDHLGYIIDHQQPTNISIILDKLIYFYNINKNKKYESISQLFSELIVKNILVILGKPLYISEFSSYMLLLEELGYEFIFNDKYNCDTSLSRSNSYLDNILNLNKDKIIDFDCLILKKLRF